MFHTVMTPHLIGSSPEQTQCHPRSYPWAHLFDSTTPFLLLPVLSCPSPSTSSTPSCTLSSTTRSSWKSCATTRSEDAYDVSTSLKSYEPNFMAFSELNDSSVPFSFMIPSSDQDVDDVTLGKMLTEAHRGQVDYCE